VALAVLSVGGVVVPIDDLADGEQLKAALVSSAAQAIPRHPGAPARFSCVRSDWGLGGTARRGHREQCTWLIRAEGRDVHLAPEGRRKRKAGAATVLETPAQ
jgi:hypothetical protein